MAAAGPTDPECKGEECFDATSQQYDENDDSTKQTGTNGIRRRRGGTLTRGTNGNTKKIVVLPLDDGAEGEVHVEDKKEGDPKPEGDAKNEGKRENHLPPLEDDPHVRRSLLYDWLSTETKKTLEGKTPIPRDSQRDQQRDQKQELDQKGDEADEPTPGENKNQIKPPAHTKIDGMVIYAVHPPVGQSVDYRWAAMLSGFDGPIAENSHLITSIVLGTNEMHPRLLISFNVNSIRNTYEINVFSSKYNDEARYAKNRNIKSILNNAFIIIHVDMSTQNKEFISTLKNLCVENRHYVHFYFIKRSVNGRIIERQDSAYWYYLDAINKHRQLPRVLYTVVRHHCFNDD